MLRQHVAVALGFVALTLGIVALVLPLRVMASEVVVFALTLVAFLTSKLFFSHRVTISRGIRESHVSPRQVDRCNVLST